MLSAVPTQPVALSREEAFRQVVEEALQHTGPEACARILQQYAGDIHALTAQSNGLSVEASEAAADKRQYFTMLTQVQAAASQKIWECARVSSELATYREITTTMRGLFDRSGGEPIPWEGVAAALAIEPVEPAPHPVTLAFLPSEQFRGGQFLSHPVQDVTLVFTFVGWALIDHGPGAYGIVEPMFLVEDRAMPRSAIEAERQVRLESYLPHLGRAA